ncbi:MAG: ABC transporter ATP-binding protein [bacterium]
MTQDINKFKRLLKYLKPYWRLQGLTFLVMICLTALTLALPAAIQYMIDTLIPEIVAMAGGAIDYKPIIYFCLFLLSIYLLEVIFGLFRDYLVAYIGTEVIKDIRLQLFSHIQRLSLRFHSKYQTGETMSRLLSDVGRIQDMLSVTLLMLFTNILMLAGILAYLLYIDWHLTLIAIIPVPITIFTTERLGNRLNRIMAIVQQKMADLSAKLQESLIGIKTIKSFGQENQENTRVESILNKLNPEIVKASVTSSLGMNFAQFINMIGPIIVLAWGVYLVATGDMKLGQLIAFYILLTYLYSPIHGLAETHIQIRSAMASTDRIFEYLDIQPEVIETLTPVKVSTVKGDIKLQDINYSYGSNNFTIDKLSLHIRSCEKIGIVGPSGSGKTTIINLIMRFYDPQQGLIELDGINYKDYSINSLRHHIALVEQDPMVFRLSVRDNIAYGYNNATDDEVITAAKSANIHDFITNLPDGYQTHLGERGVTISGGERQRLCLARAIIMNPSVLILDEATSALDSNSEELIQESLKKILINKTAIIIAHRLATIQHVDRIIVMDNGSIIDEGHHTDLINSCKLYREFVNNQMFH